ncbi:MAG: deoxyribodipyrimidine photolyase, partial [Ignavibacteria bacterium]
PLHLRHEPWKITSMEELMYEFELGVDYPKPIVQLADTRAKTEQLWKLRKTEVAKAEGQKILKKFVRPKV